METRRSVLITGGTGSVGASLVGQFAEAGYDVTFQFHRNRRRAVAIESRYAATAMRMDLASLPDLSEIAAEILVNNAGVNESTELTLELPLDVWNETLAVNLTAPLCLIQACLPYMLKRKWGRIINISSIYGFRAVETNLAYTVSKHGLAGLTKTVAREYGTRGITCNEICPGPIKSRMLNRVCREAAAADGITLQEYMREVREEIPTGRLVEPRQVAQMALFLASEKSAAINGASFVLDGGQTI